MFAYGLQKPHLPGINKSEADSYVRHTAHLAAIASASEAAASKRQSIKALFLRWITCCETLSNGEKSDMSIDEVCHRAS